MNPYINHLLIGAVLSPKYILTSKLWFTTKVQSSMDRKEVSYIEHTICGAANTRRTKDIVVIEVSGIR